MSGKITPDHQGRTAVVYGRQSTMAQVMGNLESQRRQYDLAGAAEGAGFKSVTVIANARSTLNALAPKMPRNQSMRRFEEPQ